jgi:UPF0755 protein
MSAVRRRLRRVGLAAALGLALALAAGRSLTPGGGDEGEVLFVVPPGASLGAVARDLEAAGLVRSHLAVEALGRLRGVARELRSGEYALSRSLSPAEILQRIVEGRVRTLEVVLPEGFTAEEIAQRLAQQGLADAEAFLAEVRDPELPASLGVEGPSLEGYLFPETYHLARGLGAREIARILVAEFLRVWPEIEPDARARGLSMREAVTLASIVEKETGAPDERPLIASVFHNRLGRRMRLESDPTTIYGIPGFDGNLRRRHLEDEKNPYNTYRIPALPPGPIANPGLAALRAVVKPADSEYLYFVSRNDGTHVFSRSYADHTRAVHRYQRSRP